MPANKRIGTGHAPFMRVDKTGLFTHPGPYIGIIKNNIDPTCAGRLQVYIPFFGAPDEDDPNNWITVSYSSPFRGQTRQRIQLSGDPNNSNYIDSNISINDAENSFQSYGFWFVPPDLNGKVLCSFANGDLAQGYWTGCVQESMDSHMVPGIGAVQAASARPGDGGYIWRPNAQTIQQQSGQVTLPAIQNHTMLQQFIQLHVNGKIEIPFRLPVSEPVIADQINASPTNPASVKMVPHVYQTRQLGIQGLAFDFLRGSTSASSVRENPSQVFGISTPGRLTTFADVAISRELISKIQTIHEPDAIPGDVQTALSSSFRTGGHQFVMDDGTIDGYDQGIRIRTTAGNQILLDDTNGQIYIINSTGKAWIEMTPAGKIDIYGSDDFSVRSQGNINFHADKNISMHAGESIGLFSQSQTRIDSKKSTIIRSEADTKIWSVGNFSAGTNGAMTLSAKSNGTLHTDGALTLSGSPAAFSQNIGPSNTDPGAANIIKHIAVSQQPNSKVWWQSGQFNSICYRAPAHEPWPGHEINGIKTFTVPVGNAVPNAIVGQQTGTTSTGVRGTKIGKSITQSDIANQPLNGAVCGLTVVETQALFAQIAKSESQGRGGYQARNEIGAAGKYQFLPGALISTRYIKPGTTDESIDGVNNSANWLGLNGCYSITDWLNNPSAQESAMLVYTRQHCTALKSMGVITNQSSSDDIGGYLMAAHLVGPGGAHRLFQIRNNLPQTATGLTQDKNGTTSQSYYALGSAAVQLVSSISA